MIANLGLSPDARLGRNLSLVYASNIVGSVIGILLTGFLLLDVWPLAWIACFLFLIAVASGAVLLAMSGSSARGGSFPSALARPWPLRWPSC